ncbi:response regulator transcription factor [Sulfurimonas sp. MAG313]|nr:response regulator transcription factor [Sulfurimonas sp. MAG313]MDF1880367.1 response regulator transcription factor [Sulfurimonas sp. MAG313]
MAKILLVEDDDTLAETLKELLESESYDVTWVKDGNMAIETSFISSFDLLLLDVNVPFINGFELLQSLRDAGSLTPAIFLTALSDISSISKGFEVGADDYIKKPFDYDELSIRIKSLIRKSLRLKSESIELLDFTFKLDTNELYQNEKYIALSPIELKLTRFFFLHINTTLAKEEILYEISDGGEASEGSLRVHINTLRKLGLDILNIKRVGYRLVKP